MSHRDFVTEVGILRGKKDFLASEKVIEEIVLFLSMYDTLSSRTLQLMREITERQRVEDRLRLSRKAIESTLESIFITDASGKIIDTNPSFCLDWAFLSAQYKQSILINSHTDDFRKSPPTNVLLKWNLNLNWNDTCQPELQNRKKPVISHQISVPWTLANYMDSATDYEALSVQRNAARWIKKLISFGFIPKSVWFL